MAELILLTSIWGLLRIVLWLTDAPADHRLVDSAWVDPGLVDGDGR